MGGNSTFKPERRAQRGGEDSVPGGVLSLSTVGLPSLTGKRGGEDSVPGGVLSLSTVGLASLTGKRGGEDSVPGGVLSLSTVGLASLTGKREEDSLPHPAFKAASKLSKIISWSLEEERLNR